MENTSLVVLLSVLVLAQAVSSLVVAGLFRKVGQLMATQAELKNALDVTNSDLDAVKAIVDKLVANGGAANVMTQAQLDAFVAQAQANRSKADALVEAIKPLDPGNPPPATPSISGFSPSSGNPGLTVSISGQGFGDAQGDSKVSFGGADAGSAFSWSDSAISVAVPADAATGEITVSVAGKTVTSAAVFTVEPTPTARNSRR